MENSGGAGGGATTIPTDPDDCDPGLTKCGEECVDTDLSSTHCGGCFQDCGDNACIAGNCTEHGDCGPDYALCDYVCVYITSDNENCGDCYNECSLGSSCVNGECVAGACLCDGVCQFIDIGSTVPQSASAAVPGLADNFTPECGSSGWGEITFVFTAPYSEVYVFDTLGSEPTTLQIMNPSCDLSVCNDDAFPNGTSQLVLEVNGGQTLYIVVDAQADSGSVTLNVSHPAECVTCSAHLSGDGFGDLCPSSSSLHDELVSCVCEQKCVIPCEGFCAGSETTADCQDCILDSNQGCGEQYNDCASDA